MKAHLNSLTLASSVSWILSRRECRKDLIFCCPDRESRYSDEQRTHRIGRLSLILQQPTQPSLKGEEGALMRLQELQKGKACSNPSPSHTLLLPSPLLLQGQMLISDSLPKILQILPLQRKSQALLMNLSSRNFIEITIRFWVVTWH